MELSINPHYSACTKMSQIGTPTLNRQLDQLGRPIWKCDPRKCFCLVTLYRYSPVNVTSFSVGGRHFLEKDAEGLWRTFPSDERQAADCTWVAWPYVPLGFVWSNTSPKVTQVFWSFTRDPTTQWIHQPQPLQKATHCDCIWIYTWFRKWTHSGPLIQSLVHLPVFCQCQLPTEGSVLRL